MSMWRGVDTAQHTFRERMALSDVNFRSLFGARVAKGWDDIKQIEAFLRVVQPGTVVEFGTGEGMHTLYLALYALVNKATLQTFDIENMMRRQLHNTLRTLPLVWVNLECDVFESAYVAHMFRSSVRPLMLYCDDGDKVREVTHFAPMLHGGDFLVAHDWPDEITEDDVAPLIEDGTLEYYERDVWEATGHHMAFRRL